MIAQPPVQWPPPPALSGGTREECVKNRQEDSECSSPQSLSASEPGEAQPSPTASRMQPLQVWVMKTATMMDKGGSPFIVTICRHWHIQLQYENINSRYRVCRYKIFSVVAFWISKCITNNKSSFQFVFSLMNVDRAISMYVKSIFTGLKIKWFENDLHPLITS